jgi:hypothetical protein
VPVELADDLVKLLAADCGVPGQLAAGAVGLSPSSVRSMSARGSVHPPTDDLDMAHGGAAGEDVAV